jgi:hypothetical protein
MMANNGLLGNPLFDRKGFIPGIECARNLDLPITIICPSKNNKEFFEKNSSAANYSKLNILYDVDYENTLAELDVEGLGHLESEYGIFVSDAGKDVEKLQAIRGFAQAAVQNGLPMSAAISIFESDSFPQIKDKIRQAEKDQEELQKAQQEAQAQQSQQALQVQQAQIESQQLDKEKDRQLQIELALIAAENDDKKNSASLEKMMKDFEIKQKQLELKEQEINNKLAQNNQE